jgi:anthranilate synthase/aminodeoxychorismate synthase-like glutamine amidotransferase
VALLRREGQLHEGLHKGDVMFKGVPSPFEATRYHSLIVEEATLPDCLMITAFTDQGEIMGVRHKQFPVYGVQFHPESILTKYGPRILQNFLEVRVPVRV